MIVVMDRGCVRLLFFVFLFAGGFSSTGTAQRRPLVDI